MLFTPISQVYQSIEMICKHVNIYFKTFERLGYNARIYAHTRA